MNEQIPVELLTAVGLLSQFNGDNRVVLHVDPTMLYGENYLPVMNVEGDNGFYRFPESARREVAAFFGPAYTKAQVRVDQVNEHLGVSTVDARMIVLGIMGRGRAW